MGLFDRFFNSFKKPSVSAHGGRDAVFQRNLGAISTFDGEKTPGEIGVARDYIIDHESLRLRSWQSFLESEITQAIINKFNLWVIGSGLKLQSEPIRRLVSKNFSLIDFTADVEARFKAFAQSENSDYTKKRNLNFLAGEAHKNAKLGGDVLVILRTEDIGLTVELIDGFHVQTPLGHDIMNDITTDGNTINRGVEKNSRGEIVAYHVITNTTKGIERIKARDDRGRKVAFLYLGTKYRIDGARGLPLITASLEDLKMLDRYKRAVVGGAEERQKIAYVVEHDQNSTGESPFKKSLLNALDHPTSSSNSFDLVDREDIELTTQKTTINMPNGAKLKSLSSDMEASFKDFYMPNVEIFCAAVGIPPEVALSKYDSNFSASRAALKDWENTLEVERKSISDQFYQPIYDYWLDIEVLNGRISAPEYNKAILTNDNFILSAYRNARFIGTNVPNIDPLKEVKAERLKLGSLADKLPLTTLEKATENVNSGEFDSNILQYRQELESFEELDFPEEDVGDGATGAET